MNAKMVLTWFLLAFLVVAALFAFGFRMYDFYPVPLRKQGPTGYRLNRLTGALFFVMGDQEKKVRLVEQGIGSQAAPAAQGLTSGVPKNLPFTEQLLKLLEQKKGKPGTPPQEKETK